MRADTTDLGRRKFTPAQRERALAAYAQHGPREASRLLAGSDVPVSESTLSRWAQRSGVSVTQSVHNNEVAREAALAKRKRTVEESKAHLAVMLQTIAEVAAERELDLVTQPGQSLRDIVGSRTRAVHDLALLMGEPTENVHTHATLDVADLERRLRERAGGE